MNEYSREQLEQMFYDQKIMDKLREKFTEKDKKINRDLTIEFPYEEIKRARDVYFDDDLDHYQPMHMVTIITACLFKARERADVSNIAGIAKFVVDEFEKEFGENE